MNQAEAPIPSFSFSGPTPCEGILRCAPSLHGVKIVGFGPTFAALENEKGKLLANFGTQPFKPTAELLRYQDELLSGEYDSDQATAEPADDTLTNSER